MQMSSAFIIGTSPAPRKRVRESGRDDPGELPLAEPPRPAPRDLGERVLRYMCIPVDFFGVTGTQLRPVWRCLGRHRLTSPSWMAMPSSVPRRGRADIEGATLISHP